MWLMSKISDITFITAMYVLQLCIDSAGRWMFSPKKDGGVGGVMLLVASLVLGAPVGSTHYASSISSIKGIR